MALRVERVEDLAGLDALAPAWDALTAAGAGDALFGSHVWNATWWRHYAELGDLAVLPGHYEAAIAYYRQALSRAPELSQSRYNLSVALDRSGRPREAIEQLEALLRREPANEDARRYLDGLKRRQP